MSNLDLETLKSTLLTLPKHQRAMLAVDLVASLDGTSDKGLAEAWDIEICRRINELEKDPNKLLEPEM